MNLFTLNEKNINIIDLIPLISGEGIPYKFNNNIAHAIMKEYNHVICIYDDKTVHEYRKPDGFEKFKKDIKCKLNNFEWLNENKEIQLSLLDLMPRFHGKLLRTLKKNLNGALNCNYEECKFKMIPNETLQNIRLILELLKRNNKSSLELIKYYFSQQKTIEI